jgi:hypothetical protein
MVMMKHDHEDVGLRVSDELTLSQNCENQPPWCVAGAEVAGLPRRMPRRSSCGHSSTAS